MLGLCPRFSFIEVKPMDRKEIEIRIDVHKKTIEIAEERITDLQSQLTESEPNLRHGVCAIAKHNGYIIGKPFVVIEQSSLSGSPKSFYGDMGGTDNVDERIEDYVVLIPNIFDELKAMSESLEEFKFDVHQYRINKGEGWAHAPVHIAGNNHTLAEAEAFHRNIGRMLYTLKLKAKGKEE
jgi:hypothetical protein